MGMVIIKRGTENFLRNETEKYKREMGINAPVEVIIEDMPLNVDANTTPYYRVDDKGRHIDHKFVIRYNSSFIAANENNIRNDGIRGAVVHELAHCKHFIANPREYNKSPHTCAYFKNLLRKHMRGDGVDDFKDAYRPDVNLKSAIKGNATGVAPSWLSNFWLYICPKCGFVDAYITDLKSKSPRCENCGYGSVLAAHIPVEEAAKLNIFSERKLKNMRGKREKDVFLENSMKGVLRKHLHGNALNEFNKISNAKRRGVGIVAARSTNSKKQRCAIPADLRKASVDRDRKKKKKVGTIFAKRNMG